MTTTTPQVMSRRPKPKPKAIAKTQPVVLKVQEVAARLAVSEQQVANLIECGKLHAIDIGSGTSRKSWRIPVSAVDRLLASTTEHTGT